MPILLKATAGEGEEEEIRKQTEEEGWKEEGEGKGEGEEEKMRKKTTAEKKGKEIKSRKVACGRLWIHQKILSISWIKRENSTDSFAWKEGGGEREETFRMLEF